MDLGVIVEGQFDRSSHVELIRRIHSNISSVQIRDCGGKSRLKTTFVNYLREFQRNPAWSIDAAVVIRDSDCRAPNGIEQQLNGVLASSGFQPSFRVEFFAIPCMLESWLLSDVAAIAQVARARGATPGTAMPTIANAYNPGDKETFRNVLSHVGLLSTPAVYGEIARLADFPRISARCPYFSDFCNRIGAL